MIQLHRVSQECPHEAGRLGINGAWLRNLDGIVAKIRQTQIPEQKTAVRMRIRTHAALHPWAPGRPAQASILPSWSNKLLGLIALHPLFEDLDMLLFVHVAHRHLMGSPIILGPLAVDLLSDRSSLWVFGAQSWASVAGS